MADIESYAIKQNATNNSTQGKVWKEGFDLFTGQEPEEEESSDSKTITICVAAAIGVAVIATCVYLCCRELSRRRMESEFMEELARKDFIKKNVKSKLEQMERAEDSKSYLEHMESKVPFVTFGEVTKISPAPSFDTLHHRTGSHLHLPHHHSYQPLTSAEGNNNNTRAADDVNIGSHGSGSGRANQRRLFHGDHHQHHVISASRSSLLSFVRGFLFRRQRSRSEDSESGSDECDDGIWIEAITAVQK